MGRGGYRSRYPLHVRKAGCHPDTGTCAPSRLPGRPRGLVATASRLTTDIGWGSGTCALVIAVQVFGSPLLGNQWGTNYHKPGKVRCRRLVKMQVRSMFKTSAAYETLENSKLGK